MVVSNLVPVMPAMFFLHLSCDIYEGWFVSFSLSFLFLLALFFTLRMSFESFSPCYTFISLITA